LFQTIPGLGEECQIYFEKTETTFATCFQFIGQASTADMDGWAEQFFCAGETKVVAVAHGETLQSSDLLQMLLHVYSVHVDTAGLHASQQQVLHTHAADVPTAVALLLDIVSRDSEPHVLSVLSFCAWNHACSGRPHFGTTTTPSA
jgi:hypothetical protein